MNRWLACLLFLPILCQAGDSPWIPVAQEHGCKVIKRYEMVKAGDYQLPGDQKFYAQRKKDASPVFIFASKRMAQVMISPKGGRILIQDDLAPEVYRLLLVNIEGASHLDEGEKLAAMKRLPITGPLGQNWICDLGAYAYERLQESHPSPNLVLNAKFLGYSPDEKKALLTFDMTLVLGDVEHAKLAERTFKRRYYVVDEQGKVLKEIKNRRPSGAWWH